MSISQDAFIEQAEYLDRGSFTSWVAVHPDEAKILRKLTQSGAKLISGPRGCGKTTLLLKAYYRLLSECEVIPVYVNFKHSLAMEPLYVAGDKGTFHFTQWVVMMIYEGLYKSLDDLGQSCELSVSRQQVRARISGLEAMESSVGSFPVVGVAQVEEDVCRLLSQLDRQRCVLFMDDAAHAFSPDQQRDFFDIFRQIKSSAISPKAAIYPGVTSYSASFHVGHDAEEVDVWVKPDRTGYLEFMHKVIEGRFSPDVVNGLFRNRDHLDFICYASFGIPRAFLSILYALVDDERDTGGLRELKRASVLAEVKRHYENSLKLFRSLAKKVPSLSKFVESGEVSLSHCLSSIKDYNKEKPVEKQSVSVALNTLDMSPELVRLFSLYQYAGLCIAKGQVSRGEKGRFEIFSMHYSGIIASNSLMGRKALNIADYVKAFSIRDAHEFTRIGPSVLTSGAPVEEYFELSLPPCSVCGAPRVNKDARFCSSCGARLTLSSAYKSLISQDISVLPLTDSRVAKIKAGSAIRQIKDVLLDREHKELLGVDRIGPFWAARIVRLAEEFVE